MQLTCAKVQGDPDKYQVLEGVRMKAESELRELATPEEWCGFLLSSQNRLSPNWDATLASFVY